MKHDPRAMMLPFANPGPVLLKVPPAARVLAQAIIRIERWLGHPRGATEVEIVEECARMRAAGIHTYDLGSSTNLRNRIQRNWAGGKIYREKWGRTYAPVFERIEGSHPTRWTLVKGFVP
jgi:hypothetical protein